jgi:hypothetical protein
MAQTTRLFQVQLLWNARKFDTAALVWGDLAQANHIAEGVWAQFTPCASCGMCDAVRGCCAAVASAAGCVVQRSARCCAWLRLTQNCGRGLTRAGAAA